MSAALRSGPLDLKPVKRGKVRDMYELDAQHLLIVTSDRLSAFDAVLPTRIPGKGAVLTKLSRFWMQKLARVVPNHLPYRPEAFNELLFKLDLWNPDVSADQMEVVKHAEVFPVECVVRGYITGSGWKDYRSTGEVCGHKLPQNLSECQKLPEPLFTPATKATDGHDENISFDRMADVVGKETAVKLRDMSLRLYSAGRDYAAERGILIADTKFEFGVVDDEICVVDEVLTPDSSRFWPADHYEPGHDQPSFDKQIVRNHLKAAGWDRKPPGPELPQDVVDRTRRAYRDILNRLTA